MTTITAQLGEPIRDAPGAPGLHIPGYTGQGWSSHETMLVVRWLFANPDVWEQAMDAARDPVSNPHTVADTLHEQLVPRAELDQIAALGFDPAKVNWLEIAHELIERRGDPQPDRADVTPGTIGAQLATPMTITGQLLDLTGDGHGHHIPGTPDVYRHGFDPIDGTEPGKDGIRRPGKGAAPRKAAASPAGARLVATGKPAAAGSSAGILSGPHPADRVTVASDPGATAKAMSAADLKSADQELSRRAAVLGKLGQFSKAHKAVRAELAARKEAARRVPSARAAQKAATPAPAVTGKHAGAAGKALAAAIRSGVTSRKASGSGAQGGTQVVTFGNGAQYIRKDFKNLDSRDLIVHRGTPIGGDRPLTLEGKKLLVAKEALAAKISDAVGAGAPAVIKDPASSTGFYQPKIAGKPAVEYLKGDSRGKAAAKLYASADGLKIGLMDTLTGHEDRHLGNVMITPDGKPVPIDHNDTWGAAGYDGSLFTDSPFAEALAEKIDAGKSPFSVTDLDQVRAKIRALKPEFEAMPGGNGGRYYQLTMGKLAQIRDQVAGAPSGASLAVDGGIAAQVAEITAPETITGQVRQHVSLASGSDLNPRSGMISLDMPPGAITPVPGGVDDHHITVVYLGPDLDDEAFAEAQDRARQAASAMPGPLTGAVGGIGTFPPSDSSDGKVPAWAGVVLPGAERLRSSLEDLSASEHPDWKPHVTLAYVKPGEALPAPVPQTPVTFTHLSVHRGNDEVARFPLGGSPEMANPVTIVGQLAATISGQLELAGGWRDAWRHEFRDAHGRWTRTPGELAPDEDTLGAAREGTQLAPTRASDLSEGDRVMLPHPVTGDLAPGTITERRDVGDRVELDVRRADGSVDTANLDRSEVVDRIDSDVEPEQFPDEVDTGDDEKPPPVVPKPAPPRVLLARPALYTYQRQKIVALGLDADHSQPSDVRQGAARVRLRMPLTAAQSAALAGALRAQASSGGVRPVQARALERAAHRFDAAAAEVHGSAPPVFDGGRVSAVSTDARNMTEGDTIALARPDGTIGVVTVRGIRPSMGGRVITMDLEHQDGTRETRVLTGRTKGWLLPDKADDEPVPPPGDRREHITPDQLRVGDEIALDNAGLPGKTGPVTSIEPEGNGYRVGFTDGHRLYSGLIQSYDGGPAVVRTARGPASQDQPWDSVMQAEHPERIDPAQMRVGDRVRLGQGPDAATGVIHSIERSPAESGGDGYLVGLRADNSETSGVFVAPGEGVTRLVKGDDNAAARIADAKAERLRAQRAQVIRDVLDRVVAGQRAGDQGALGIAIGHPSDEVLKNALSQSAPSPHNAREAATRIRQMIAPMLHDSGGAEAEKLAEDRIVPVLQEIAQRDHDNFVRSLLNATAGLWDPEDPNASRNITRARQRVLEQWRGSPPPTDTGQVSRALAAVADALTEASGEEAVNGRPGVPVLPEGTDLVARVAAYRAALPAPEHIGKKQVTRAMFAQPHLADLEAGRVPPVTRETMGVPDVAEDGGPGHTAMRHLDIVMAAGKDLDAELQKRITASLGITPEKQARHEAAAARLSDIGRERMALYREEKEASDAAGDARARELGYPNLMGLSVKARVTGGTPEVRAHYDDALAAAAAARKQVRDKMDALKAERKQLEATDLISDKARADAQREAALQLLAQVRADGVGGVKLTYRQATGKQSVMSERSELVQAMRFAEGNYPTAWLAKARDRGTPFASATAPGGTERAYRLGPVTRGHYADQKREIRLSKDSAENVTGGGERARVATHELGHAMEKAVPGLLALQHSYLWSRTSSGEIGSRKREKKAPIYAGEYGYRDTLPLHYTGKDYGSPDAATVFSNPNVAFEVLTTGAESLFAGSTYLDDSFRQWLLGTLATV